MGEPVASRVRLPAVYGAPDDSPLLDWPSVVKRIAEALHYWVSTADADGIPIARPVDGNWVRGALYFGGDPTTRWRRNLAVNPQASLTLEEAESPVILEGSVETTRPDEDLATALAESSKAKYGWGSVEWYRQECCVLRPRQVMTWSGVFEHATRFTFV